MPFKSVAKIVKYAWHGSLLLLLLLFTTNSFYLIFLYNIFIAAYSLILHISSLWNPKAKDWLEGRKFLFSDLRKKIKETDLLIWIHSASAGEFEQAKPIMEGLKKVYPGHKIVATLFSPSGYNQAKKYSLVDCTLYLPLDTPQNAKRFLDEVRPQLIVFIKYDYWYYHLKEANQRKIPMLLASAIFLPHQTFFKWYGGFYRKMLLFFNHIFVQDRASIDLLQKINIENASVSGDTRFDRVIHIANEFAAIKYITGFINNHPVFIAGSTWPEDEKAIKELTNKFSTVKFILAPHEINSSHINQLQKDFPASILYSQPGNSEDLSSRSVLIIDNVGMLSRLYHYATVAYIGGGFTKDGIHNALEAAVFGKPVLFGPNYKRYREAEGLIEKGGAFSFSNASELENLVNTFLTDHVAYEKACTASKEYVYTEAGATEKILNYIQENRLLTN